MDLSPTTADQAPLFTTAAQCGAWLDSKPFANTVQGQAALLKQLGLLNRYSLPASERLAILDLLAPTIAQVQEESARKFAGKPLPLTPPEQAAYDACQALWQALTTGHMRCLESCLAGEAALRSKRGHIVAQALRALADSQADAYRGGRLPGTDFWRLVHELIATAEQLEVAGRAAATGEETPLAVYGEIILLHLASPNELTLRQLAWVVRWARRWGGKLGLAATAPNVERAIPICVDLASDRPPGYQPASGKSARWLDTIGLRVSLGKRLTLLDEGQPPAKLQLGDDCLQPACGQLLKQIYRRWCKGGFSRRHERRPGEGTCSFVAGFEAAHYHFSGRKPFRPPGQADVDQLRREREEIATFGRVSNRREENGGKQLGFKVEEWEMLAEWDAINESATGVQIAYPARQSGSRIAIGQLVAVRPPDAQNLMLGNIRWAAISGDDRLHAGVQIFPGLPQPVAVRGTGLAAVNEKYQQSFLLPAVPTLREPATAVVPAGWYKRDRVLEVYTDHAWQIRLTQLVERGQDYERVAYQR